ncbi:MAG TPA: YciI family protein [Micromonosporaceae bacterium]|nr:YciI family protein [Micromonosporaceae bacterium]
MEFFCYHRDRPGSVDLRDALLEEHWSYMDRYSTEMIARGRRYAGRPDVETRRRSWSSVVQSTFRQWSGRDTMRP